MSNSLKNKLRFIAGFAISALCMYLALRGTDLSEVLSILSKINFIYLVPTTVLLLLAFFIRAMRWRYLLASVKSIPTPSLFASTMIGFMANNVLPFRAGEFVRAYSIARNENISLSSSLASLVIERLFDGMSISLFFLPLFFVIPLPAWLVNINYLLLSVYALGAGGAAVLIWVGRREFSWLARRRWEGVFRNFTAGLEVCRNGKEISASAVLSLAHWFAIAAYYYLLFLAFGFSLSFLAAIALVVIVGIGIMLPAAPGYVGNFQYFTVLGLAIFSIPPDQALAYSLVAHAGQFVPVTLVGLFYFFRQSAGLSDLRIAGGAKPDDKPLAEGI
jgi:hypothetical protein